MNIALIGPSGVGKVTHAIKLAERLGMSCCISGQLLRENHEQHTAAGILARPYMQSSNPVPDVIVDAIVESWMYHQGEQQGLLFVGYPRTVEQSRRLDRLLAQRDSSLDGVIILQVSDQTVARRLGGRVVCTQCQTPYHLEYHPPRSVNICDRCGGELQQRPEDIPELIKVRLRSFRRNIAPMMAYYRQSDRVAIVDADAGLEEVEHGINTAAVSLGSRLTRTHAPAIDEGVEKIVARETTSAKPGRSESALDLVLLGGPGSGKGTQAEHLRNHLGLPHIATGDLFRENLNNQTSLGKLAKSYMDRGALVPDDVTEAMVEERILQADAKSGFILDGFPRNINQAHALNEMTNAAYRNLKCALYYRVSDEEIVRRLSGRIVCRECQTPYHVEFKQPKVQGKCDLCAGELYQRDDDNPDTVRARLQTFHEQTGPIVNYYRAAGILKEIDGEGEMGDVIQRSIDTVNLIRE